MTPEMFRKLAALGLSHDQMAGVLEIFEADAEERKAKARARVQKWRDKNKPETQRNVTQRNGTSRNATPRLVRGIDNPSNSENHKEDISSLRSDIGPPPAKPTPLSELEVVLDTEHAQAVISHRKALRKKLSDGAAKRLAAKLAKWPDPNEAADEMIAAGWMSFEPEWLEGRKASRGQGPPRNKEPTPWQRQMQAFDEVFDERSDQRSAPGPVPCLPGTGTDGQ